MGTQKNRLETVLLSIQKLMLNLMDKKIILILLSKSLSEPMIIGPVLSEKKFENV